MKKFIISTLAAIFLAGASFPVQAEATVFHHFTKTDNGDSCFSPEEVHDQVKSNTDIELMQEWKGDDLQKLKVAIAGFYNLKVEELLEFDSAEVYSNLKDKDNLVFVIYDKGCMVKTFPFSYGDYLVIVSSIAPAGTLGTVPPVGPKGKLGFNPGVVQ